MSEMRDSLTVQAALLTELMSTAVNPVIREQGLTPSLFELLSTVHASDGHSSQIRLCERMGLTPPSFSEAVKAAAQRGLLEQLADPSDRRKKIIRITKAGKKKVEAVLRATFDVDKSIREFASESDLQHTLQTLKTVNLALARKVQENP